MILNLAVWFAGHVLLSRPGILDFFAIAVCVVTLVGMVRWKWDVIPVVIGSGLAGLLYRFFVAG